MNLRNKSAVALLGAAALVFLVSTPASAAEVNFHYGVQADSQWKSSPLTTINGGRMYTGLFATDLKQQLRTAGGTVLYNAEHVNVEVGGWTKNPASTSSRAWCLWKGSYGVPGSPITTLCWYNN